MFQIGDRRMQIADEEGGSLRDEYLKRPELSVLISDL
jgi:hypothetical protein